MKETLDCVLDQRSAQVQRDPALTRGQHCLALLAEKVLIHLLTCPREAVNRLLQTPCTDSIRLTLQLLQACKYLKAKNSRYLRYCLYLNINVYTNWVNLVAISDGVDYQFFRFWFLQNIFPILDSNSKIHLARWQSPTSVPGLVPIEKTVTILILVHVF